MKNCFNIKYLSASCQPELDEEAAPIFSKHLSLKQESGQLIRKHANVPQ